MILEMIACHHIGGRPVSFAPLTTTKHIKSCVCFKTGSVIFQLLISLFLSLFVSIFRLFLLPFALGCIGLFFLLGQICALGVAAVYGLIILGQKYVCLVDCCFSILKESFRSV